MAGKHQNEQGAVTNVAFSIFLEFVRGSAATKSVDKVIEGILKVGYPRLELRVCLLFAHKGWQ